MAAGFAANGRFDLAYEVGNFAFDNRGDAEGAIKNYHRVYVVAGIAGAEAPHEDGI